GFHRTELLGQLLRSENQVGGRRQRTRRSHVGHLDVGLDAELLQRLLGIHPEDQAGAESHPAHSQDLHDVSLADWRVGSPDSTSRAWLSSNERSISATSRASTAPISPSRRVSSDRSSASVESAVIWPSSSTAASPMTRHTGSFSGCPNATGSRRVTRLRPARRTAGDGREWARAMPGAITM